MHEKKYRIVAGLGNPGEEYQNTRHNAGFMAVDLLSQAYQIPFSSKVDDTVFGIGNISNIPVVLLKPLTYMNRSGGSIHWAINTFRTQSKDMIIIHDDIDLAFGRLKIKEKGGDGGHRGLKSIINSIGGDQFIRLRIGVGKPHGEVSVPDYVLGEFHQEEKENLTSVLQRAKDAVVMVLSHNIIVAMNQFNSQTMNS